MAMLVEELSQQARTLSPHDRARLAEDLLASLDGVSAPEPDTEAAWTLEIQRRVDEVNNGTAKLVAAEDVYAETGRLYR